MVRIICGASVATARAAYRGRAARPQGQPECGPERIDRADTKAIWRDKADGGDGHDARAPCPGSR